mgnify:CR=1 FL=1
MIGIVIAYDTVQFQFATRCHITVIYLICQILKLLDSCKVEYVNFVFI